MAIQLGLNTVSQVRPCGLQLYLYLDKLCFNQLPELRRLGIFQIAYVLEGIAKTAALSLKLTKLSLVNLIFLLSFQLEI